MSCNGEEVLGPSPLASDLVPKWMRRKMENSLQKRWRHRILRRDGHRCRACGSTEGVEAAHVYGWWAPPQKRWSEEGLLALCHRCHQIFDRRWGERDLLRISSAEDAVRFLKGELKAPFFPNSLFGLVKYLESLRYEVWIEKIGNYEYHVVKGLGVRVVLKERCSPSTSLVKRDLERLATRGEEVLYLLQLSRAPPRPALSLLLDQCRVAYFPSLDEEGFTLYLRVGEPRSPLARELERLLEGRVRRAERREIEGALRRYYSVFSVTAKPLFCFVSPIDR